MKDQAKTILKHLNALKRDISSRNYNDAEETVEDIGAAFNKLRSIAGAILRRQNTSSANFNKEIAGNKQGPGMRHANDSETIGINGNITRYATEYAKRFRKFTEVSNPFSTPYVEKLGELVREASDFCRQIISE
jgi:hypothetical protein